VLRVVDLLGVRCRGLLQHILVAQKLQPTAAAARSPYTNVTSLEEHGINYVVVLHVKLAWCFSFIQSIGIKKKPNLVNLQTLQRTVRLHKFSQLSTFLDLEINNISVLALDLHIDILRFCL